MKILLLFTIILSSFSALAAQVAVMQDQFEEDRMDKEQADMVQERLEKTDNTPSSTAIGGSKSGELDFEKKQQMEDVESQHDLDKQKQLYEYDDKYRRGL